MAKDIKNDERIESAKAWPVDGVTAFCGPPNKKSIAPPTERFKNASTFHVKHRAEKPNYTAGRHFSDEPETEDFDDSDNWAAGTFYGDEK